MGDDDPLCWPMMLHNTPSINDPRVICCKFLHVCTFRNTKDDKGFTDTFSVHFGPLQDLIEGTVSGYPFKDILIFASYVKAVSANRKCKGILDVLVWGHMQYLCNPAVFVSMTTEYCGGRKMSAQVSRWYGLSIVCWRIPPAF